MKNRAEQLLELVQRLPGFWIPKHLEKQIRMYLENPDPDRQIDMVMQLMRLALTDHQQKLRIDLLTGKFLYKINSQNLLVFGQEEILMPDYFVIIHHIVINNTLCCLKRSHEYNEDAVVWNGNEKRYPFQTVDEESFQSIGDKPCYRVRLNGQHQLTGFKKFGEDENEAFVMWGDDESPRYSHVDPTITSIADKPAYTASSREDRLSVLVWGNEEILRRAYVGQPLNFNESLVTVATAQETSGQKFLLCYNQDKKVQVLAMGKHVGTPMVIAGELAYYIENPGEMTLVCWGERRMHCQNVLDWEGASDKKDLVFLGITLEGKKEVCTNFHWEENATYKLC